MIRATLPKRATAPSLHRFDREHLSRICRSRSERPAARLFSAIPVVARDEVETSTGTRVPGA